MGIAIPQVIAEDRASGAQVIDGSLKFEGSKATRLDFANSGSSTTFTASMWVKRHLLGGYQHFFFSSDTPSTTSGCGIGFDPNHKITVYGNTGGGTHNPTDRVFRDTSSWYHLVLKVTSGTADLYVNNELAKSGVAGFELSDNARIGDYSYGSYPSDISMSQVYVIDGQALGPEYFGFTDPLTNTWRPKKYTGTFGTNGFYLPMDGNSPIGEDKSGNGNNWTPVNFGGSNTIEKATGALPILNTVSGGKVATVGVRTDATVAAGVGTCVLALPFANPGGSTEDVSNQIDSGSTEKAITPSGNGVGFSTNNFYGRGWYFDGQSTTYVEAAASNDFVVGTGDFTIEGWFNPNATQATNGRLWGQQNPGTTSEANADYDCYIGGSFGTSDIQMNGGNTDLGMNFPTAGEWHHIAVCRSGTNLYSFMNGVLKKITPNYTNNLGNNTDKFRIAKIGGSNTGFAFAGGVQDFRFYNGVAKYTSDFIPASINPDILPDTPSGVSGGSKLAKIANGSVGFAGTSRLSIANSSETELGTDPFTMEAWIYKNSDSANPVIASKYVSSSRSWYWSAGVSASDSNQAFYYYYGINGQDGTYLTQTAGAIPIKKWTHCAVSRDSNDTIRLFIDGKRTGTITITDSNASATSTAPMELGMDSSNADGFDGMISNFRFVKGTALYTSNFTPPTEPLTNITNTKLLCAQSASEHKDITGRLYKSGTLYTTRANIVANATPLEGGETLSNEYLYYVPSGNELTRQQIFSADGAITNSDSINGSRWGWLRHDGTNWVAITGSYGTGQFDEFYFDADDTALQLDQSREFYALRVINGTVPEQNGGTAPTLRKQFVLDAAVIPFNGRRLIDQLYEPTVSNFNPFTTDINTVRGQETGYATFNPLNTSTYIYSNGNLTGTGYGATKQMTTTTGMSSGKFYAEFVLTGSGGSTNTMIGISKGEEANYPGQLSTSYGYIAGDGNYYNNGAASSYGSIWTYGDVMGVAVDMDNNKLTFYKNGISQGEKSVSLSGTYFFAARGSSTSNDTLTANFGQKPFKFPPPDGFQPLNDANAKPETVIARPDQFVGVTTYPGDSSQTQLIKLNMQPDLVWIKSRFVDSANHILIDSVRGDGNELYSNNDQNEGAPGNSVEIKSNGFTVPGVLDNRLNGTNRDYVAWSWKAGGNKNTFNVDDVGYATAAAAGLDGGTITPTGASVGTKQGFSIISYTGIGGTNDETISHGLSQSPDMVIIKNRHLNTHIDWAVAHTGTDDNRELHLNTNEIPINVGFLGLYKSNFTSTTFAVNASANVSNFVNASNQFYIAYVWHNVPGLQKFGRYEGNGDTNGPYVELGFKPAILWLKNIDSDEHWYVYDSVRSSYNPAYQSLMLSNDIIEENGTTNTRVDLLSNGFKLRQSNGPNNANTYIYAAWAEAPSINLYGGQSNAR